MQTEWNFVQVNFLINHTSLSLLKLLETSFPGKHQGPQSPRKILKL